jgi:hypothetical protein
MIVETQMQTATETPQDRASINRAATVLLVVAAIAILYGLLLRAWLLVQLPIFGDEAIVGIMARAIDGGHFTAFYWGQHYGGLEPYLVAVGLKLGGGGEPALNATPVVLSALGAGLVGGVVFVATRSRALALAATGTVWVWPYVVIWQSAREGGFREATLCCGLAALLCCVQVYRRRAGWGTFAVLGLSLGLGWWASPEILYFVLPCLAVLAGWWWAAARLSHHRDGAGTREPTRWVALAVVAVGGLVGSLPWWWANVHTRFASLANSSLPSERGTYGERLSVFFHYMLPLELGVRTIHTGDWVGGPVVGKLIYVALLVLVAVAVARTTWLALNQRGALVPLALGLGVVTYPFVFAALGTLYWEDGRYGIYLPTLIVVFFGAVLATVGARSPAHTRRPAPARRTALIVAATGVLSALCLTVAGARTAGVPADYFTSWHSGDAPMEQVIDAMRAHHMTAAYGDYWTAYDLDFLSRGSPAVSPSPLDVVRSTALAAQVASAKDPPWLFYNLSEAARATTVFQSPQPGPGPYNEETFEAHLRQTGVPYKVVRLGILDAVVPAHKLATP